MNTRTLLVWTVAVFVPAFCLDISDQRCDLRERLRTRVFPMKVWERKIARVICEVEKFVKQSVMRLAPVFVSGSQFSSEQQRGHRTVDTFLRHCTAVDEDIVTIDPACFEMDWVFRMVYLKAGEECKKVDPVDFFQSCPSTKRSKRSVYEESNESLDSEELPKSRYESESGEYYEEPLETGKRFRKYTKPKKEFGKYFDSREQFGELLESRKQFRKYPRSRKPFGRPTESMEQFGTYSVSGEELAESSESKEQYGEYLQSREESDIEDDWSNSEE